LEPDLALFSAGDRTEVGEKGITLRYAFLDAKHDAVLMEISVAVRR